MIGLLDLTLPYSLQLSSYCKQIWKHNKTVLKLIHEVINSSSKAVWAPRVKFFCWIILLRVRKGESTYENLADFDFYD